MKQIFSLISILTLSITAATGCVTMAEHDDILGKLASETKAHNATATERDELANALKREQANSASLTAQINDLRNRIAVQEKKNSDLNADLADLVKSKSALRDSVADMKTALRELQRRKAAADRRIAQYKNLLSRFKALIDAGKLSVKIVDGRMVVALATDILFKSGSAKLSQEGKDSVAEVTAVLVSLSERAFQVEGHTDNVPIKKRYRSNWHLAAERALNVVNTMIEAGMPANRVSAASYGEHKPAASNDDKETRALNRRIEIVVVPDLSSLPGFEELQKAGS